MAEVPEKEASVSPSPRRKRRWWIIPVCAAAAALLAVLALLWSRYVLVAGQLCPRDAAALDLRQEELSVSAYTALARKLPDCEIRWSVPLGGAHYDSASESLAVPAVYAGEEANFAFFPRLKSLDLRQADLTAESFAAIRAAVPACAVRWSIPIGGKTYDSAAKSITVSDFTEAEVPMFLLFDNLKAVNGLACTCWSALAALAKALPDCSVHWQVPLGGTSFGQSAAEIQVDATAGYAELRERLAWLPALKTVAMPVCSLTAEEQAELMEAYPKISFLWPVTLCGTVFSSGDTELSFAGRTDLTEADLDAIAANVFRFPALTRLDLTGCGFSNERLAALRDACPGTEVLWTFDLFGVTVSTLDAEVDLSNTPIGDLAAVEAALPYLPKLEKVVMCDCGPSDEEMDALNKKYADIRFVWMIHMGQYSVRTDATGFITTSILGTWLNDEQAQKLRYCTDMLALDLGHRGVTDLSFLYDMPHLKYLILSDSAACDLTPVASLQELLVVETFMTSVADLTPLLSCGSLVDLNICYIAEKGDALADTLCRMTRLQRLWYSSNLLDSDQQARVAAALPDCKIYIAYSNDYCVGGDWRYNDHYYEMRDILGMHYMDAEGNRFRLRLVDGEWVLWDTEGIY